MDIYYKGKKLYSDLTPEKCSEILEDLAFEYYAAKTEEPEYDPKYIEVTNHKID